jgi:pyruvyltransferase
MRKAYWWRATNFGDTLTPIVLSHFLEEEVGFSSGNEAGRIVGIGSILHHALPGDIIFGAGSNRPSKKIDGTGIRFLAVRGPLSRAQVVNAEVPEIYGDPAILLPLIYDRPRKGPTFRRGILPHYVDLADGLVPPVVAGETLIDIQAPWMEVIDRIRECDEIVSSSLHGIIAAEAYGIQAIWKKYPGSRIIGGEYKFQDYFLGTGREEQKPDTRIAHIPMLAWRQGRLLGALETIKS